MLGEELGLLGSNYFVKNPTIDIKTVNYMINMDMVGRLNNERSLAIYGLGTSPIFKQTIKSNNEDFKIIENESGVGPSDHTSFYLQDIPVLHFFTGQHSDYHKPSDDSNLINYFGMELISNYIYSIISDLDDNGKLSFKKTKNESQDVPRFKVTLGVIPDYLFQDLQFERLNKIDQHVHLNHKQTSIEHDNVCSCSFLIREDIDELKLRSWLAMLYSLRPFSMLRLKGIVKLNTYDSPLLLQAVGAIFYDPKVINEWPSGDKLSRLIIIFKDFSEESIKKSFSKWVLSE